MYVNQRGNAFLIGLIIGVFIIIALFGAYSWGEKNSIKEKTTPASSLSSKVTSASPQVIPQLKNYTNEKYKISFDYPSDMTIKVANDTDSQFVLSLETIDGEK